MTLPVPPEIKFMRSKCVSNKYFAWNVLINGTHVLEENLPIDYADHQVHITLLEKTVMKLFNDCVELRGDRVREAEAKRVLRNWLGV